MKKISSFVENCVMLTVKLRYTASHYSSFIICILHDNYWFNALAPIFKIFFSMHFVEIWF